MRACSHAEESPAINPVVNMHAQSCEVMDGHLVHVERGYRTDKPRHLQHQCLVDVLGAHMLLLLLPAPPAAVAAGAVLQSALAGRGLS